MNIKPKELSYPVLLWRKGYTYLAETPLELCAHPRSLFEETVQLARAGEWRLVDADGRCFKVSDWERISPFGGIKGVALRLIGSIFAAPVLENEEALSLAEFKKKLTGLLRSRYRYDLDKSPASDAVTKLRAADSHRAAINALPKL